MQKNFPSSVQDDSASNKKTGAGEKEKPEITHIGSGGAFSAAEGVLEEKPPEEEPKKETPY